MTKIKVKEIVWDKWNTEHIKKHGVTTEEVMHVGENFVYHKRAKKGRYAAISRVGKRIITLVLNRIAPGKYYLVTAYDSSKKKTGEVYISENLMIYEKENKKKTS